MFCIQDLERDNINPRPMVSSIFCQGRVVHKVQPLAIDSQNTNVFLLQSSMQLLLHWKDPDTSLTSSSQGVWDKNLRDAQGLWHKSWTEQIIWMTLKLTTKIGRLPSTGERPGTGHEGSWLPKYKCSDPKIYYYSPQRNSRDWTVFPYSCCSALNAPFSSNPLALEN